MGDLVRIASTRSDQASNLMSGKVNSKLSLVASIPKACREKALQRFALKDQNIFNMGTAIDIGWFLLKMTALELVRRFSKAHCASAWHSLQILQIFSYPPFKWIQKWSPFNFLVTCMQTLSKPLLVLSIATSLPYLSDNIEDTSSSSGDDREWRDSQSNLQNPDSRSEFGAPQSLAPRKWMSQLVAELEKEGLTLPERINEDELLQFYDAANGDISCFMSSIKKTIRWRQKFKFLSMEELEDWSDIVFWHSRDTLGRPCLIIRLGLGFSKETKLIRSHFRKVVVSQIEYGVLHLIDAANPQITVLMDCEGLTPFHFPMQMMRSCTILLQDHYPNRLAALIIVRLPPVARVIARTLFQVLRPATRQKVRIEGDNYKQILLELLQALPSFLGGDCSCLKCSGRTHDQMTPDKAEAEVAEPITRLVDARSIASALTSSLADDVCNKDRDKMVKLAVISFLMVLFIAFTLKTHDFYGIRSS